jgi:hypothetical protein
MAEDEPEVPMRLLGVALLAASLVAAAPCVRAEPPTKTVEVTNFPNPQNVTGAVEVTNLPAVQNVTGIVEVTNLPSPKRVQPIGLADTSLSMVIGPQATPEYNQQCKDTYGADAFVCNANDLARAGASEIVAAGLVAGTCAWLGALPESGDSTRFWVIWNLNDAVRYFSSCPTASVTLCCAEQ